MFGRRKKSKLKQIEFSDPPKHIAVIMDGNGRWARKRNLPRIEGHRAGAKSVRDVVETAARLKIKYLTLFAFSTENWSRSEDEIGSLMKLLDMYLEKERKTVLENNIQFRMIGRRQGLSKEILAKLNKLEKESSKNSGMVFNLALNYSGRTELVDCVKQIAEDVNSGKISSKDIDEGILEKYLYTAGQDDPDLLIRTSGEFRISNFLLWQIAYSEIWITDILWPDFRAENLIEAIEAFRSRNRRFGGVDTPIM